MKGEWFFDGWLITAKLVSFSRDHKPCHLGFSALFWASTLLLRSILVGICLIHDLTVLMLYFSAFSADFWPWFSLFWPSQCSRSLCPHPSRWAFAGNLNSWVNNMFLSHFGGILVQGMLLNFAFLLFLQYFCSFSSLFWGSLLILL